MIVLCGSCLMTRPTDPAEGLAANLEVLFCNLTVVFGNVNHDVVLVQELGDVLGATVPLQRFSNALTKATVVAGVMANSSPSGVSLSHPCL